MFINQLSLCFVMDAVIIGVSDRTCLWRHGKIKENAYPNLVSSYAKLLASLLDNVIVTPDDGVYTDIALEFGKMKGKKPIAYYPDKDTFYGIEHIKQNFPKYELRAIDGDWYKLNADLTKQALTVICIGFSPGVLIEGAFIKYHQKYGGFKNPKVSYSYPNTFGVEDMASYFADESYHRQSFHLHRR